MRERPQAFRRDGSRRCSDIRLHHGDCLERLANRPALLARLDHDFGDDLGHDFGDAREPPPPPAIEADDLGQRCAKPALTLFPRHTTPRRTPHTSHCIPSQSITPHRIILGSGVMQRHPLFASICTHTPHRLGGHLAREEVEDGIDGDILPPELQERRGRRGAGLLMTEAIEDDRPAG